MYVWKIQKSESLNHKLHSLKVFVNVDIYPKQRLACGSLSDEEFVDMLSASWSTVLWQSPTFFCVVE